MRGADPGLVRRALADRDPLPGTTGFAGALDGRLVRDVLGREPLYTDPESGDWSHDPADLDEPVPVPAGHVREGVEAERVWHLPDPDPVGGRGAVEAVRRALDAALDEVAARGTDGPAVAF